MLGLITTVTDLSMLVDALGSVSVGEGLASLPDDVAAMQERLDALSVKLLGADDELREALDALRNQTEAAAGSLDHRLTSVEAGLVETREQVRTIQAECQIAIAQGASTQPELVEAIAERIAAQLAALEGLIQASPDAATSPELTELIATLAALQHTMQTSMGASLASQREAVAELKALSAQHSQSYASIQQVTAQATSAIASLQGQVPAGAKAAPTSRWQRNTTCTSVVSRGHVNSTRSRAQLGPSS